MLVMGILNTTPDSFADGGQHFTYPDAVNHGLQLIAEGADITGIYARSNEMQREQETAQKEEQCRLHEE
jgi:dihydropteroate synthase